MPNTALHKQNGPKSWFLALIYMNHYFVGLQALPTLYCLNTDIVIIYYKRDAILT